MQDKKRSPRGEKPTVIVGMLGPVLDAGTRPERWEKWRPSVAMCRQVGLPVSRVELLHHARFSDLAALVAADVREASPATRVRLHPIDVADPWDFEAVYGALFDFAKGHPFAPDREDYLVHITTGTHVEQICLFLLTESRYLPGRLLQTSPPERRSGVAAGGPRNEAREARERAVGRYAIIDLDLSKYDRIASRFSRESRDAASLLRLGIPTRSRAYDALMGRLEQVALASGAPILLLGPTGAGKSQLARRIFELKKGRRLVQGDLVEVNCATVRGDAAMSTLFGHVRGAFTGATTDRPGLLRRADGGLLFLDEIGELGPDEQAMLLRAVEQKTFLPVGSDREARSDFQLLAGTNRELGREAAAGRFRADLLARIDLWTFRLPALRDRLEDLEPNLDFEIERASALLGVRVTMSREAREAFLAFGAGPEGAWPGNFRDLGASVTRMSTLAAGGRISASVVREEIERLREHWAPHLEAASAFAPSAAEGPDRVARALGRDAAASLDRFDRAQLADVLSVCERARSLSEAGRALFAASRAKKTRANDADRLRKYLARFGLAFDDLRRG